jgi:hypothetical protein
LQLGRLVERITRNFGEKRLTDAVFLDVAKAFDTAWIDGLLRKLTFLNFSTYIVHTVSSYLRDRTFVAFFQATMSSRRGMWAGVAQGGFISPVLFSLYVSDMPPPSHHVELALCGRLGRHSQVTQADAACQLPGFIAQRPSTVAG